MRSRARTKTRAFDRRRFAVAAGLLCAVLTAGCAAAAGPSAGASPRLPSPSPYVPRSAATLPPPSAHPSYPPKTLADLVALADRGLNRRLVGMESGVDQGCGAAWVKVHEVDGTAPAQIAADLMQQAIARHVLIAQCGGFVYGTVDVSYCNCYLGDHGLLTIERGSLYQLPKGEMTVTFQASDIASSPGDWELTVPWS